MAIDKDSGDTRTYEHEAIVVDPLISGPTAPDWPAAQDNAIDFAIVLIGTIIVFGNYEFQFEHYSSGAGGPWGVVTQRFQPGRFLARIITDAVTTFGSTHCKARVTQL